MGIYQNIRFVVVQTLEGALTSNKGIFFKWEVFLSFSEFEFNKMDSVTYLLFHFNF